MSNHLTLDEAVRQLRDRVPGLYEIWTVDGRPLKVGISDDLGSRLKCHAASRESGLQLKTGGAWGNPDDVRSKASIFAKHLFFDSSVAPGYDLKSEFGRRAFIKEQCRVLVVLTESKAQARALERERERSGQFRYVGKPRVR